MSDLSLDAPLVHLFGDVSLTVSDAINSVVGAASAAAQFAANNESVIRSLGTWATTAGDLTGDVPLLAVGLTVTTALDALSKEGEKGVRVI